MDGNKICPFCGEAIKATAKKCRFCGEWLSDSNAQTELSAPPAYNAPMVEAMEAVPVEVATPATGNFPMQAQYPNMPGQPVSVETMPGENPSQTIMSLGGQPIVLNIQQNQTVEQTVEQNVEQTVIVESAGSSEGAPGWIFTEMWCIAVGVGLALKSWWWFLGIGVIGSILLMVPLIGALMCIVIGAGWGLIAAAIGHAFFGTSAAWVLGILVGGGAIYGHLEARKQNMEEE